MKSFPAILFPLLFLPHQSAAQVQFRTLRWTETYASAAGHLIVNTVASDGRSAWSYGGYNGRHLERRFLRLHGGVPTPDTLRYPGRGAARNIFFLHDSSLYIGGGVDSNLAAYAERDFWRFDQRTGQWQRLADLPFYYRLGPVVVPVGDAVWAAIPVLQPPDFKREIVTMCRYNPETDGWQAIAQAPDTLLFNPAVAAIGPALYVHFQSYDYAMNGSPAFFAFDTETGTWKRQADFPAPSKAVISLSFTDGRYFYAGTGIGQGKRNHGELYRYDPNIDKWYHSAGVPGGLRWGSGWMQDGLVYVGFGIGRREGETRVWRIDTQ